MKYFDDVKVGDKVWSKIRGWGRVIEVYDAKRVTFPIYARFEGLTGMIRTGTYTLDGKYYENLPEQELYYEELRYEKPRPPRRNTKVWLNFYVSEDGSREWKVEAYDTQVFAKKRRAGSLWDGERSYKYVTTQPIEYMLDVVRGEHNDNNCPCAD